jgi:N-acetyl-beta-hexosaminidase
LSNIIDQFSGNNEALGELLDSAKAAVMRARETVHSQMSSIAVKKAPAQAEKARSGRLTEEGRSRISLAAKKRWAVAKRKEMKAVTKRQLSKTA